MTSSASEISTLFERRSEAIGAKDIDLLMSLYADDIVYFDVVPPLRYAGATTLRTRFSHWFDGWDGPIRQEIRDLEILAAEDVAAAHMLIRAGGIRKGGPEVGYWVRTSNSCRRSGGRWLITHEHVSLPVDFVSRTAVMDLAP